MRFQTLCLLGSLTAFLFLPFLASSKPLWSHVCRDESHPALHLPFCNSTLSLHDRIEDYVARIPTESKIAMMSSSAAGYEPLGIPPYQWWSEGLHGPFEPCVTRKGKKNGESQQRCPTSFPCPSGLGNAFNRTL
jgi:hypothetical protein